MNPCITKTFSEHACHNEYGMPMTASIIKVPASPTSLKDLRVLTVAEVPPDPNAGAAGTILFTNRALKQMGCTVTELWANDLGRRRIAHGNLHSLVEQPSMMKRAVLRQLQKSHFDVVLSHQPQSYLAAKAVRRSGWSGRFVVVSQGIENRITPILAEWHRRLNVAPSRSTFAMLSPALQYALSRQWPLAAKWTDGLVVQHREDQEFLCRRYGVECERTHLWDSGLPDVFLSSPRVPMTQDRLNRLLYVGQFAFYKAPQLLAQVVNRVLTENPVATMTWICHESHHAAARSLLDPSILNRVTHLGWMRHEDLKTVFDAHGVLVFPTIAEGFGRVPLEAMSRGMCVISSNCCGMRDYIRSGVDGRLCTVGDVESFCRESLRLQFSVNDAERISRAAYVKAQSFTWERVAGELGAFLTRLSTMPKATTPCVPPR